jgi:predicted phosphoribosyltransferase
LDIVVAKKITTASNPELALGAVTATGEVFWTTDIGEESLNSPLLQVQEALHLAHLKAQQQLAEFTPYRPVLKPHRNTYALLVDDGMATGMTIIAAMQAVKRYNPAQVWICAPVAPRILVPSLERWCDDVNGAAPSQGVILLPTPQQFGSVSRFYASFPQVSLQEAINLMQRHNESLGFST